MVRWLKILFILMVVSGCGIRNGVGTTGMIRPNSFNLQAEILLTASLDPELQIFFSGLYQYTWVQVYLDSECKTLVGKGLSENDKMVITLNNLEEGTLHFYYKVFTPIRVDCTDLNLEYEW